jgi:hypothetical protein
MTATLALSGASQSSPFPARNLQQSWSDIVNLAQFNLSALNNNKDQSKQIRKLKHDFNNTLNSAQLCSLRICFNPRFQPLLSALKLSSI